LRTSLPGRRLRRRLRRLCHLRRLGRPGCGIGLLYARVPLLRQLRLLPLPRLLRRAHLRRRHVTLVRPPLGCQLRPPVLVTLGLAAPLLGEDEVEHTTLKIPRRVFWDYWAREWLGDQQ
jgi:hypothetical protein